MSAPADFAAAYRQHVIPRLKQEIATAGMQLSLDLVDWTEANSNVFSVARRYGAMRLPDKRFSELQDFISGALLDQQLAAEMSVEARKRALAEREASDPVHYYTWLSSVCSAPSVLRWTFAAISPAYRRHLLAEVRHG